MIQIKSLFVFQSDVSNRSLLALRPIEFLNCSRYSNRFRTVRTVRTAWTVRTVRTVRAVRTVRTVGTVQTVWTIWTSSNSSNYSDKFEHVRTLHVRFDQVRSRPHTSLPSTRGYVVFWANNNIDLEIFLKNVKHIESIVVDLSVLQLPNAT